MNSIVSVRTREATIADSDAVGVLQRQAGLEPDTPSCWRRIWEENPFRSDDIPIGWVLEAAGETVGYIGNVPLIYNLGGREVRSVAARGWVVDPRFRDSSLRLLMNYWGQQNVDILLNSSSNAAAFQIFKGLGAGILPHDVFKDILFWVVNAPSFVTAAMVRLGMPRALARIAGPALGIIWAVKLKWDRRKLDSSLTRLSAGHEVRVIRPSEIDDSYDRFWQRKVMEKRRFLADRSATSLRWHFGRSATSVKLISAHSAGELCGYLAFIRKENAATGFVRHQIIDLVVANDDPTVINLLVGHARCVSDDEGVDVLELIGFPDSVRNLARSSGALRRTHFPTPFTYRLVGQDLSSEEFNQPSLWYPSLFDGDGSL